MKVQAVATVVAALAGSGLALPQMGVSPEEMGLVKRGVSAAQCLARLCCPSIRKRDLQDTEALHQGQSPQQSQGPSSEQQATCLICWKFGVCDRGRARPEGNTRPVTVEVTNFINQNSNNNNNNNNGVISEGFWVPHGGRDYWVDQNGLYWEWFGDRENHWRMGGHGSLRQDGDRWMYIFED